MKKSKLRKKKWREIQKIIILKKRILKIHKTDNPLSKSESVKIY